MNFSYKMNAALYQQMLKEVQMIFAVNAGNKFLYFAYFASTFIAAFIFILLTFSLDISWNDDRGLFIASLIFIGILPFGWYMNRQFLAAYTQSVQNECAPNSQDLYRIAIDTLGVSIKTDKYCANIHWNGIKHIYATSTFFIMFSGLLTICIPYESIKAADLLALNEAADLIETLSTRKIVYLNGFAG
jgi:hypothetical protein